MSTTQPRWLTEDEDRAWRTFRAMMIRIQTSTARDLGEVGLSEADYEVLSTLSERDRGSSALHLQAEKMGWSRSRLSRHASRMEQRGLIRRDPDPGDRRGCILVLTEKGLETLAEAAPHHVDSVRRHVMDRLTEADVRDLERIARKVLDF